MSAPWCFSSANLVHLQCGEAKVATQRFTGLPIICPPTTVLTLQDSASDIRPLLPQQARTTTERDMIMSSMCVTLPLQHHSTWRRFVDKKKKTGQRISQSEKPELSNHFNIPVWREITAHQISSSHPLIEETVTGSR